MGREQRESRNGVFFLFTFVKAIKNWKGKLSIMECMTSLEREISKLHNEIMESPNNIELKLKYGHACLMREWRLEALRIYKEVLDEEDNADARLALVKIFVIQRIVIALKPRRKFCKRRVHDKCTGVLRV